MQTATAVQDGALAGTPLEGIVVIHRALRRDMSEIDLAAYHAAATHGDLSPVVDRLLFFSEVLGWHAGGEDEELFPALERVAPDVARAYALDHHELDTMTEGLARITAASDGLIAARATAALTAHLRIHLHKEEVHLFPLLHERTAPEEQIAVVGRMARKTPAQRMPDVVRWLYPLIGHDDRELMTRIWMSEMPPEVFLGVKALIRQTIADDWAELTRRIPALS